MPDFIVVTVLMGSKQFERRLNAPTAAGYNGPYRAISSQLSAQAITIQTAIT